MKTPNQIIADCESKCKRPWPPEYSPAGWSLLSRIIGKVRKMQRDAIKGEKWPYVNALVMLEYLRGCYAKPIRNSKNEKDWWTMPGASSDWDD